MNFRQASKFKMRIAEPARKTPTAWLKSGCSAKEFQLLIPILEIA